MLMTYEDAKLFIEQNKDKILTHDERLKMVEAFKIVANNWAKK